MHDPFYRQTKTAAEDIHLADVHVHQIRNFNLHKDKTDSLNEKFDEILEEVELDLLGDSNVKKEIETTKNTKIKESVLC